MSVKIVNNRAIRSLSQLSSATVGQKEAQHKGMAMARFQKYVNFI